MRGDNPRVPQPHPELLAARRALEGMDGFQLLNDWSWNGRYGKWVLHCRLSAAIVATPFVPASTEWYLLAETSYPWGTIGMYPAKRHGLVATFPHQEYNGEGAADRPWRDGKPCLTTDVRALGRVAGDAEPHDAHERLHWHLQRALDWLRCAADGDLSSPGEPYEIPQFPTDTEAITVAFTESRTSLSAWATRSETVGKVDLVQLATGLYAVTAFRSARGQRLTTPAWGSAIEAAKHRNGSTGAWIRFDAAPVLPPWQVPMTWGELRTVARLQGFDLDAALEMALQEAVDEIRDGKPHIGLVGFPIPARIGEEPAEMYWQALVLPTLSHGSLFHKGFRRDALGYWMRDRRTVLRDDLGLRWGVSENWHSETLEGRGQLPPTVTAKSTLLIGIGALGAVVGELLLRGGTHRLVVTDGDTMRAGNLVRHPLELGAVQRAKADAVAAHLNAASPHANVTAITSAFPPHDAANQEIVRRCEIVVDCTGDDTVLHHLTAFEWQRAKTFISLSLGLGSRRLYCFAARGDQFPHEVFEAKIAPWLRRDIEEWGGQDLRREGVGCWHPVFPARADDIWLLASVAVKHLVTRVASPPSQPELAVFEQTIVGGEFEGVRRADRDGAPCVS